MKKIILSLMIGAAFSSNVMAEVNDVNISEYDKCRTQQMIDNINYNLVRAEKLRNLKRGEFSEYIDFPIRKCHHIQFDAYADRLLFPLVSISYDQLMNIENSIKNRIDILKNTFDRTDNRELRLHYIQNTAKFLAKCLSEFVSIDKSWEYSLVHHRDLIDKYDADLIAKYADSKAYMLMIQDVYDKEFAKYNISK